MFYCMFYFTRDRSFNECAHRSSFGTRDSGLVDFLSPDPQFETETHCLMICDVLRDPTVNSI